MDKLIGEKIKSLRLAAALTQAEFAEKLSVSLPTVNRIERGHRTPDADLLVRLNRVFSCDLTWLLTGEEAPGDKKKTTGIPLLSRLTNDLSTLQPDMATSYISLPEIPDNALAIRVEGDDMLPIIGDGDTVIFTLETPKDGDVVIFEDEWGRARVRRLKDREGLHLVAAHPEYQPIEVGKKAKVVGKVIWAVRCISR